MSRPFGEPCGCAWGSADNPFKVNAFEPENDNEDPFDPGLKRFTECLECGAVWSSEQDNAWVAVASKKKAA